MDGRLLLLVQVNALRTRRRLRMGLSLRLLPTLLLTTAAKVGIELRLRGARKLLGGVHALLMGKGACATTFSLLDLFLGRVRVHAYGVMMSLQALVGAEDGHNRLIVVVVFELTRLLLFLLGLLLLVLLIKLVLREQASERMILRVKLYLDLLHFENEVFQFGEAEAQQVQLEVDLTLEILRELSQGQALCIFLQHLDDGVFDGFEPSVALQLSGCLDGPCGGCIGCVACKLASRRGSALTLILIADRKIIQNVLS